MSSIISYLSEPFRYTHNWRWRTHILFRFHSPASGHAAHPAGIPHPCRSEAGRSSHFRSGQYFLPQFYGPPSDPSALRIQGMDGIRLTVSHLFYDRHDISVGMFNRVIPHLPVLRNHFLQIRNNQLVELFTVEEGVHIKAIIGAQGKTIQQMASCIESCGKFQAVVQSFLLSSFKTSGSSYICAAKSIMESTIEGSPRWDPRAS